LLLDSVWFEFDPGAESADIALDLVDRSLARKIFQFGIGLFDLVF
jgi:hypothetical protein